MLRFQTLHDILPADAREDRQITLIDGQDEQRVLSFARLRQRALGLLGALQRQGLRPGHAMLLCVDDNERFLEMFWACVLGGMVAVPLAPPGADEHRRKLLRVFGQFERVSVYIDAAALERMAGFAAAHGLIEEGQRLRACAVLPTGLDIGEPGQVQPVQPDDLAFIQYSSGSTGEPKGVMLTHRNLCANIAAIREAGAFSDKDVALSWMPLSHDMGLIGFHLNMLACGVSHGLMRTDLFARRPLMWLEQASLRRATVLCSPNFGYQHYLRQYEAKLPRGLDLSAVRLIFNGAEPISAETCRRFVRTMAAHGLKPNAMFTVYGLAEASLAVSFPRPGSTLETIELPRAGLRVGTVQRRAAPGERSSVVEFVKLGTPVPGTELRITGEDGAVCGEQVLGHVQMRGDNVTRGYYHDEARTLASRTPDGWFDTGDLGLLWDGQLVIAGRAKDLVIVNGQNHYPHDLERIAEQIAGIEAHRVAAAGVRRGAADSEALALFVQHRAELDDFVPKVVELRRALLQQCGLEVAHVVPVRQIPRTSSGKLQRYALATAFEQGEFDEVLAALAPLVAQTQGVGTDETGAGPTARRLQEICAGLVADQRLTLQTNLLEINLNSLTLARIHEAIEREFPQRIDVTDLFDYPTLEQLAEFLDTTGA